MLAIVGLMRKFRVFVCLCNKLLQGLQWRVISLRAKHFTHPNTPATRFLSHTRLHAEPSPCFLTQAKENHDIASQLLAILTSLFKSKLFLQVPWCGYNFGCPMWQKCALTEGPAHYMPNSKQRRPRVCLTLLLWGLWTSAQTLESN